MNDFFDWKGRYKALCQCHSAPKCYPVIGITGNYGEKGCELAQGYYQSVFAGGASPVVIPPSEDESDIDTILEHVDGLVFSGGSDLNPLFTGEEPSVALHSICPQRDRKELLLLRMALDRQIPLLCICRGIQLLAIATGGSIYQDIYTCHSSKMAHVKHSQELERSYPSHSVILKEGSLVRSIFGKEKIAVNSFHHQAVSSVGNAFTVCGQSVDGIIEAIESKDFKSVIGVQWHPECFILRGDKSMLPLFKWLSAEASEFSAAKKIHSNILSLDTHCDTPMFFDRGIHFDERDPKILVDLHKMREGHLDASIMAAYLPQGKLDEASLLEATSQCDRLLNGIETIMGKCEGVELCKTPDELYRMKHQEKKAIMRAIENGYAIGRDLSNIERYKQRGVVYMTLCHNGDNLICDSACKTGHLNHGVSLFGEQVIREMNRVGMMVDLSHGGEESFWNALEISATPIVCSHASCRALCNHPRNLTDEQLRALAKAGGVCQITLYPGFLRENGQATIEDALAHLQHAVDIMGIDHVGLGTDFDGDGGVIGLGDASELINFTRRLLRLNYSETDISKIWGRNFLRVMQQVQDAATINLS